MGRFNVKKGKKRIIFKFLYISKLVKKILNYIYFGLNSSKNGIKAFKKQ
jgi:hypothetical protein|tara:strand:+ start:7298 stop:7444 length:147 start_codon:yes stop_codon:yes gene_type:complete